MHGQQNAKKEFLHMFIIQYIFNKNKIRVTVILTNRRGPLCIICFTIKNRVFPKHGTANMRVKILIDNTS